MDAELGEIPAGWEVKSIGDLAMLSREGVNPGDTPGELFQHYSIPAYDDGCMPKAEMGAGIKSHKHLVAPDCVLISKLNPRIPRVWLPAPGARHRSVCSTEFLVVRPKPPWQREFLYCLFTSHMFASEFASLVTGTSGSHQRVRPQAFTNLSVICPPPMLVNRFTSLVARPLARIAVAREASRTLAALRDALLPKLISGELRVQDADRFIGRAT